jgi:GDP/UDP-N,N'-diacetylbacillosamine 2-epimerase (hydrolysing)
MTDKISVYVVTGTRADYGIYFPLLSSLENHDQFDLKLIVTGMHLSPFYGYTIEQIIKDGFKIAGRVDNLLQGSTEANMAKSVGLGILGMTNILEEDKPEVVVVLGDRGEMLAASIAATHLNIPVAHIHGGEVSGSIDESVRHAISKLSHLHFPATEKSAERILKMGEDPWRIHRVGAPRIDTIVNSQLPDLPKVKNQYELFGVNEYYLFVYHPVTTELMDLKDQVRLCLEALKNTGEDVVIIKPNSDAGNQVINEAYEEFSYYHKFHYVTNFSPMEYLTILKGSKAMIGNSSSGIIEAASFKKAVINIGNRQKGREQSANVINVKENKKQIEEALAFITANKYKTQLNNVTNVYGDGKSASRIMKVLSEIDKQKLIDKIIAY